MDQIIENLKKQLKKPDDVKQEDGIDTGEICFSRRIGFSFVDLALFTKYLQEEREALRRNGTGGTRQLNTQKDIGKAYSQQHLPTIPQFYEHVSHRIFDFSMNQCFLSSRYPMIHLVENYVMKHVLCSSIAKAKKSSAVMKRV